MSSTQRYILEPVNINPQSKFFCSTKKEDVYLMGCQYLCDHIASVSYFLAADDHTKIVNVFSRLYAVLIQTNSRYNCIDKPANMHIGELCKQIQRRAWYSEKNEDLFYTLCLIRNELCDSDSQIDYEMKEVFVSDSKKRKLNE